MGGDTRHLHSQFHRSSRYSSYCDCSGRIILVRSGSDRCCQDQTHPHTVQSRATHTVGNTENVAYGIPDSSPPHPDHLLHLHIANVDFYQYSGSAEVLSGSRPSDESRDLEPGYLRWICVGSVRQVSAGDHLTACTDCDKASKACTVAGELVSGDSLESGEPRLSEDYRVVLRQPRLILAFTEVNFRARTYCSRSLLGYSCCVDGKAWRSGC